MPTKIADLPLTKQRILRKISRIQCGLFSAQLIISILIAIEGRAIIGDSHAEILTYHIEGIFPAARRLGSLCANRLDGELTLCINMSLSILFGASVFAYFYVQKSARESAISFRIAMEELTAGKKIVGYFFLMAPIALVLSDFGFIDIVGFASGKGFSNPGSLFYRYFSDASGIKLGLSAAFYTMAFSTVYGLSAFIVVRGLSVIFHYDEVGGDSE